MSETVKATLSPGLIYEYHDVDFRGSIERVTYTTTNPQGEPREKYANVYLPYGYNPEDKETQYAILYVIHGGGGNPDAWLDCCKVKNMLDYCFHAGVAKSFIAVFPSYYKEKIARTSYNAEAERDKVWDFMPELTNELLPAVEGKYNGYAAGTSPEALQAARAHRGIGGFSMGSCTTWFTFLSHLPYFRTFVPLSGDCWEFGIKGGSLYAEKTVEHLCEVAAQSGLDFNIYSATGTEDPACESLVPQIEEMKRHPEVFTFSEEGDTGNLHFYLAEGQVHAYEAVYNYLYTFLPYLFS